MAFRKYLENVQLVRAEERDFRAVPPRDAAPWRAEKNRREADMYIIRSRTERRRGGDSGDATAHGGPDHESNLLVPARDESTSTLRARYMTEQYERSLASSGKALLVSRISIGQRTESMTQMHFHRSECEDANGSRSSGMEILGTRNDSIVIAFENDAVKNSALTHINQATFDLVDEKDVKLDATQLCEETAKRTEFVLGHGPLKSIDRLDNSLRPFFTNKGHVLTNDVRTFAIHGGRATTKVLISHAVCPSWLQKTTVTREGPRDQQIRLERSATCIYCNHIDIRDSTRLEGSSQPPRRSETTENYRNRRPRTPTNQMQERPVAGLQIGSRGEIAPGSVKAPQQNRYQNRPVAALRAPFPVDNGPKYGDAPKQDANIQSREPSTNAIISPAGASTSHASKNPPNRKVMFEDPRVPLEYVLTSCDSDTSVRKVQGDLNHGQGFRECEGLIAGKNKYLPSYANGRW